MSQDQRDAIVAHYAPLYWLVRKLHGEATLKHLVVKHRWKRKRPQVVVVAVKTQTKG